MWWTLPSALDIGFSVPFWCTISVVAIVHKVPDITSDATVSSCLSQALTLPLSADPNAPGHLEGLRIGVRFSRFFRFRNK